MPKRRRSGLSLACGGLPPSVASCSKARFRRCTGKNAFGNSEWLLPDPPQGETRHYLCKIFATDLPLVLMPGRRARAELPEKIRIIARTITACAVLHATFTDITAAVAGAP